MPMASVRAGSAHQGLSHHPSRVQAARAGPRLGQAGELGRGRAVGSWRWALLQQGQGLMALGGWAGAAKPGGAH